MVPGSWVGRISMGWSEAASEDDEATFGDQGCCGEGRL